MVAGLDAIPVPRDSQIGRPRNPDIRERFFRGATDWGKMPVSLWGKKDTDCSTWRQLASALLLASKSRGRAASRPMARSRLVQLQTSSGRVQALPEPTGRPTL